MKFSGKRLVSAAIALFSFIAFVPNATAQSDENVNSRIPVTNNLRKSTAIKFEETTTEPTATPTMTPDPTASDTPTPTPSSATPTDQIAETQTPEPILSTPTPENSDDSAITKGTVPGWGVDQAGYPCYYLDTIGTKVTNYFTVSGKLYYANPTTGVAIRTRGWFTRHDGVRCYAWDGGWLTAVRFSDNGNDYYVNYGGTLIANQYMNISGKYYYAGHDGVIKKNGFFTRTDGVQCYASGTDGSIQMTAGTCTSGGNVYFVQTAGVVAKNQYFMDSTNNLRYAQANGIVISNRGWFIRADGVKCYAWTNGALISVRFTDTDGNDYYVNYGGTLIGGQYLNISGSLYYAGHDGAIKKHGYFVRDDGITCYAAGTDGSIRTAMVYWKDGSAHSVNSAGNVINMTIRRALLIGNSDYAGSSNDLYAPPRDAAAMERALAGSTFYFNNGYKSTILTNKTSNEILSLISACFSSATENDTSLFFYSGHGVIGGSTAGAMVGVDGNYVTPAQVKSRLDSVPGQKILIIDSCGSGAFVKKAANGSLVEVTLSGAEKTAAINSFNNAWINTFAGSSKSGDFAVTTGSKYTVLTACDYYQYSYEGSTTEGVPYSFFTDGITWGAGFDMWSWSYSSTMNADEYGTTDNVVTAKELYNFSKKYTESAQTVQSAIPSNTRFMQDSSIPVFMRGTYINLASIPSNYLSSFSQVLQ